MNCSPCLARGRQREASRQVLGEPWCWRCYGGSSCDKGLSPRQKYMRKYDAKRAAAKASHYRNNREAELAYAKKYYESNKERIKARQKRRWDDILAYKRAWKKAARLAQVSPLPPVDRSADECRGIKTLAVECGIQQSGSRQQQEPCTISGLPHGRGRGGEMAAEGVNR